MILVGIEARSAGGAVILTRTGGDFTDRAFFARAGAVADFEFPRIALFAFPVAALLLARVAVCGRQRCRLL